jgi:hypothetical protein
MAKSITTFLTKNRIKNIIGISIGALGGFLYYYFIGCTSGNCAITSNPYMSILWGAVLGYLLFDIYKIKEKPKDSTEDVLQ